MFLKNGKKKKKTLPEDFFVKNGKKITGYIFFPKKKKKISAIYWVYFP